jgi:uncharacterized membrane protein
MAIAATAPAKRSHRLPEKPSPRKSRAGSPASGAAKTAKTVKRGAKTAKGVRKAQRALPGKAGSLVTLWRLVRLGRRLVKGRLPAAADALREGTDLAREVADLARDHGFQDLAGQLRRVPVQVSLDVAVPVEVAYDEWMQLDFLPEGSHRVEAIERQGQQLFGEIRGSSGAQEWEGEVRDARRDESFAWRSRRGSDVAGLITFHRLGERLTRLELGLDIVPVSVGETVALTLHLSDRLAEANLRRFKLRVETISPDDYPRRVKQANRPAGKRNQRSNKGAQQGKARNRRSRNESKEG